MKAGAGCWGHLMLKVISLYVEAHEPSLASRRLKRAVNCVLKLKSLPENSANSRVFEPENVKLFADSPSKIRPLGIRMLPHVEKSKINLQLIDDVSFLDTAPRMPSAPTIRFDLTKFEKDTTNPETY